MRTGMKLETLLKELQPQIMAMLKEHKSVADEMENKIEGLPATSELKTGLRTKLDSFLGGVLIAALVGFVVQKIVATNYILITF